MIGPTTALMLRSIRVDTRSWTPNLLRIAFVLVVFFALLSVQQTAAFVGAPGRQLFGWLAYMNFFIIVLAGVGYFASAITEEKEEETLGLLRMTGLNSVAILLGKTVSRLINALILLAVQLPFVLLSITLGGVSVLQIVAVYATLATLLIFVAGLAVLLSVLCASTRNAASTTFLVLLVYFGGIPLLWLAADQPVWMHDWVLQTSAFYRLTQILSVGFDQAAMGYQAWTNLAAGLVCFVLGWVLFEFGTQKHLVTAPQRGTIFFASAGGRRRRRRRAWDAALLWKDFHFVAGGLPMMLIKFVVYVAICAAIVTFINAVSGRGGDNIEAVGWSFFWIFLVLFVIDVAFSVARSIREEIKHRTAPLVGMLPGTIAGVVYPKLAGAILGTLVALPFVCFGGLLVADDLLEGLGDAFFDEGFGWLLLAAALLFIHLSALLAIPLRWGAVVLAGVAVYIGNMFAMMFIALISFGRGPDEESVVLVFSLLMLTACGAIHPLLLHWYARKAAE